MAFTQRDRLYLGGRAVRADVVSLAQLFRGGDRAFAAPFHQRPYRWARARNWVPFWAHWTASCDAASAGGGGGRRLNFLGAIVCRQDADPGARDAPDDALRPLEVLDGQQRLLTAMMAMHALRLRARALGEDALAARLDAALSDAEGRPRFVAGRASYADQTAALATEVAEPEDRSAGHGGRRGYGPGEEDLSDEAAERDEEAETETETDTDADLFAAFDAPEQAPARAAAEAAAEAAESPDVEEADLDPEPDAEAEWRWDDASGAAPLRAALRFFNDRIRERTSEDVGGLGLLGGRAAAREAARATLARLASGLLDDATVVLITLDPETSPFDVFERLNNLGEPLSALELLKNQLFRSAERGGRARADLEALYRSHWRIFDDARNTRFWARPERRGRDSRTAQDWFLRAYLSVRETRNVPMNEAARRVGEIAESDGAAAAREIAGLCEGARAFAEISGHLDPGPHRVRVNALRRFARFAAEPALVAMRMHLWSDADATAIVLALLESVAVRRFFTGAGSGKDYEVYARLARVIGPGAAEDGGRCAREVARRLRAAQGGKFWPKDGEFKRAFATKKLANRNSSQQARDRKAVFRAVFEALDGAARGAPPSDPAPWRRHGRTVEHLYPLHGRDHWPELAPAEADLLETIGNLTLVDDALNKRMGQAPWSMKRRIIAEDAALRLNEMLLEEPRWRREWGPAQIKERGRDLATLAVKRWPRPR